MFQSCRFEIVFWFSLFVLGVCDNNQGAEPCEGAAVGAGGGDHGTQGWEEQHKGENHFTGVTLLLYINLLFGLR